MERHQASCTCGQLKVTVEGGPVRVSVCHCLACQRRTGSAFGVQARFRAEQVTVVGDSREYIRLSDEDAEPRRFHFCDNCGATVFYDFGPGPDIIAIPVGAFADPMFPAPTREIYDVRRHPWVEIGGASTDHLD